MPMEYHIIWHMPEGYDPSLMTSKLPSPISRQSTEIYNYAVQRDEFYFRDNRVDPTTAGHAMKILIDEALKHTNEVVVRTL